jgi:hypothetical protein
MHRVGRDKFDFINFRSYNINNNDIVIYQFGEVDCRCHIGRQLLYGRQLDIIIDELIINYIDSIKINCDMYANIIIIICCIPPTMCQKYYEDLHGSITHQFPFIGNDSERILYTRLMNDVLKNKCRENNFIFLDYYDYYINDNNTLKIELSDNICHIDDNLYILNNLYNIIDNMLLPSEINL